MADLALTSFPLSLAFLDMLGGSEIAVIFLLVLIFFGGEKMPEFARGLGKAIREFRKAASGVEQEFKRALEEDPNHPAPPPPPTTFPPYPPPSPHTIMPPPATPATDPAAESHPAAPAASPSAPAGAATPPTPPTPSSESNHPDLPDDYHAG
jgi:TatA/E family protein of Tat protein translocase